MVAVLSHADRGDEVRCTFVIADLDGNPPNPDTVKFSVISPVGAASQVNYTQADSEVTNVEPGEWELLFTADRAGSWLIRAEGTGNVKQVARGVVRVDPDVFS